MELLALIFIIIAIIAMISFWFGLGQFTLGYLDNYVAGAPDWLNTGNLFGWVVFTLAFLIIAAILKFIFGLVNTLIGLVIVAVFAGAGTVSAAPLSKKGNRKQVLLTGAGVGGVSGAIVAVIAVTIGWIIFSVYATKEFFAFTAQYPDLTDYFVTSNWIVVIMVFFSILGIVAPSNNNK